MLNRLNSVSLRLMAGWAVWTARLGSEKGQTMVEYGLIIALVAVVVISALVFLGNGLAGKFTSIANTINNQ